MKRQRVQVEEPEIVEVHSSDEEHSITEMAAEQAEEGWNYNNIDLTPEPQMLGIEPAVLDDGIRFMPLVDPKKMEDLPEAAKLIVAQNLDRYVKRIREHWTPSCCPCKLQGLPYVLSFDCMACVIAGGDILNTASALITPAPFDITWTHSGEHIFKCERVHSIMAYGYSGALAEKVCVSYQAVESKYNLYR